MQEKILYHGTDVLMAESQADVFGLVYTDHPEISGNLTDDLAYAKRWALRVSEGQPDWARVLVFRFDIAEIVRLGFIGETTVSYATRFRVPIAEVPDDYFLAKRPFLQRENFIRVKTVYFYKAPREKVIEVMGVS